jgi:hypothetical protein
LSIYIEFVLQNIKCNFLCYYKNNFKYVVFTNSNEIKLYYKDTSFIFDWLRERKSLSRTSKILILAYLYNKGSQGANSYTKQQKANIPYSQEYNRFKEFLKELCVLSLLEKYEVEITVRKKIIELSFT